MKINWKHLATTKGYKSLKAAYIYDVRKATKQKNPMRNKDEFVHKFQWVMNRAKHYAHNTNRSLESVLNDWESERTYWWLNYYQDSRQSRFNSGSMKPMGISGIRKYYKKRSWSADHVNDKICDFIKREQRKASTKRKKRWTSDYKKSIKRCL
jgi:hypothetical protein